MHAMETGNDLPLLRRAGELICKWHHETMIRAAAELGTVQVLCWQSRDLCAASAACDASRTPRDAVQAVKESPRAEHAAFEREVLCLTVFARSGRCAGCSPSRHRQTSCGARWSGCACENSGRRDANNSARHRPTQTTDLAGKPVPIRTHLAAIGSSLGLCCHSGLPQIG
jgi:hypothetical protein